MREPAQGDDERIVEVEPLEEAPPPDDFEFVDHPHVGRKSKRGFLDYRAIREAIGTVIKSWADRTEDAMLYRFYLFALIAVMALAGLNTTAASLAPAAITAVSAFAIFMAKIRR